MPEWTPEKKSMNENSGENMEALFLKIDSVLLGVQGCFSTEDCISPENIVGTMNRIRKLGDEFSLISDEQIDSVLSNEKYRIDILGTLRFTMNAYKEARKNIPIDMEDLHGYQLSSRVLNIYKRIHDNLFRFPENYNIENIENKGDMSKGELPVSNELLDFFASGERYGQSISNYLYLAEKALMNDPVEAKMFIRRYGYDSEIAQIIIRMYIRGSVEVHNYINSIFDEFTGDVLKYDLHIESILGAGRKTSIEDRLHAGMNNFFNTKYGIEQPNFSETLNYTGRSLSRILVNMDSIEEEYPGGCKELNNKFNISEFGRYPYYVLIEQLREQNDQSPYGLMVFPKTDENGAFYEMASGIANINIETENKHLLRVYEASGKMDLARILLGCDKKYGENNKISFLILGGHGSWQSLDLGSHLATTSKNEEGRRLVKNDFTGEGVRRTKDFFVEKPAITLISCETGADEGIINDFSKTYDAEVVAPKVPTSVEDMHAEYDDTGRPHFKIKWRDDDINSLYISGKKIE